MRASTCIGLAAVAALLLSCENEPRKAKTARPPDAPTAVIAEADVRSARVRWTTPTADGGKAITGYTVTADPGGATATTSDTATTVAGLENGTAYTFTVTAANEIGAGPPSAPSAAVTTPDLPGMPSALVATPGNGTVQLAWTAPAADGGSPITGYTVRVEPPGDGVSVNVSATTATVSGLANGTAYTFRVAAVNAVGDGAPSDPSAAVTPFGPPGAPGAPTALAGDQRVELSWTEPTANGREISGYRVTTRPGGATLDVSDTRATVPGLENGTAYTFTVAAVNEAGVGPDSLASMPVTPATVPAAPAGIVAVEGDGAATLSWTPPADGGSPIAGYLVEIQPATPGATIAVSGAGATIGSLTNGIAYTFRVAATNAMGDGPWSEPSAPVTPFAPLAAGSHTIVFSFTTSGLPAAPVGGIQLAVALPAGISVSADPATGEIDTGAIHAGGAVPGANVIAGSYAASTRRVSLALASTAEAAWSGEFLRLDVTVEPGLRLGADDLLRLNAPLPAFEAVGVDTATHRTVVLTEQVQPGLALVNP